MHLLFLCSQNKRRSLTAEKLFDGYEGHQARSAGTENNARVKVTPGLLGWADMKRFTYLYTAFTDQIVSCL